MTTRESLRRSAARLMNDRTRASRSERGLAIAYHGVGPVGERHPLDITLDVERFEEQVRYLQHHYDLVPSSELLDAVKARRWGQKLPLAITFDDDLRSHLSYTKPVLDRLGVPATFFIGGASLHGPLTFWWERLELAYVNGSIDVEELRALVPPRDGSNGSDERDLLTLVFDIEFMAPHARDALNELLGSRAGSEPDDAGLRPDDIRDLSDGGRYEIGFHTRSHYNLTVLEDAQLAEELTAGRSELARIIGRDLTSIAYPGGRWNHRVVDATREAGFELGFTCDPVPADPDADPLQIGRLVPTWCKTLGQFAIAVSSAMAGRNEPWPVIDPRPGTTLATEAPAAAQAGAGGDHAHG
jgi:peptidoglycan/xylan/chitin deacetylase (PgdA/CDA1 family)